MSCNKFYLCDGKQYCRSSSNCYMNGGNCMYTQVVGYSISEKYPEFATTYFLQNGDGDFIEHIDPSSIMRTFMADNPTPDLTRLAMV